MPDHTSEGDQPTPSPQSLIGARVDIHYHLRRRDYAITSGSRVIAYADQISLTQVEFRVQPAGRARAIRERRRQVHAYAKGAVSDINADHDVSALQRITYNPFRHAFFYLATTPTPEPLRHAEAVIFHGGYAYLAHTCAQCHRAVSQTNHPCCSGDNDLLRPDGETQRTSERGDEPGYLF